MLLDKQNLLSSAQAITATAASSNIFDTGAAADAGPGEALKAFLLVVEAFNTLTSLDIALESATDAAFTTPVVHYTINKLLAALTLNAKIDMPPAPAGLNRYLRFKYTVNGSNPSTGKLTGGFMLDDQRNTPVADALPAL